MMRLFLIRKYGTDDASHTHTNNQILFTTYDWLACHPSVHLFLYSYQFIRFFFLFAVGIMATLNTNTPKITIAFSAFGISAISMYCNSNTANVTENVISARIRWSELTFANGIWLFVIIYFW